MAFDSPDIETFRNDLDNQIASVQKLKTDSHASIKIQSLLNITVYVLATRFLEGSVKHIIHNCCVMRGDNSSQIETIISELKKFNNPDFTHLQNLFNTHLGFDINQGIRDNWFSQRDISMLNEIVRNRHRNVHATHDSADWYNSNLKDLTDFNKEFIGLENILTFLDLIKWDSTLNRFTI